MAISTNKYLQTATNFIKSYYEKEGLELEVIQVWYCKTIQNHKGWFIVRNVTEDYIYNMMYEVTYNGELGEMYFDIYKKFDKKVLKN